MPIQIDVDHVLASTLHRLLNRDRHFTCLAIAETDLARPVTNDRQRGKPELATTFDNLGNAINRHEFFDQVVALLCLFVPSHSWSLGP
jgi:hypothetical protein